MKKNLLLMLTAMMLSMAAWSCSDDEDLVFVGFTNLEYRHIDFEMLPQPVQDEAKKVGLLYCIIKGKYNGQEAYMLGDVFSSLTWGPVIYADGTEVPFEEVSKGVESGVFNKWVCIYHSSRDGFQIKRE